LTVYQNSTFTDTVIPFIQCHPIEHKYAIIRYLYDNLNTYNLRPAAKQHERSIVHNILYNSFPIPDPYINPLKTKRICFI
jgi:hypothetical protein